jgi:hypothetical protein
MHRHELRFVLRFGAYKQFNELAHDLHREETARGWAPPRLWRATSGQVNQVVIEHDYASVEAFRTERTALQDDPGNVGEILARLSELAVPGSATEFEFSGIESAARDE